jgi:hypothetical protein
LLGGSRIVSSHSQSPSNHQSLFQTIRAFTTIAAIAPLLSRTSTRRLYSSHSIAMADVATAIPASSASSISGVMEGGTATPPMSKLVDEEIRQARAIPTTWRESISAWWASDEADAELSETRLLRCVCSAQRTQLLADVNFSPMLIDPLCRRLPFFRSKGQPDVAATAADPDPITARVAQIPISPSSNPKRFLNTLSMVSPSTANSSSAVVLLHGYGAGKLLESVVAPLVRWLTLLRTP